MTTMPVGSDFYVTSSFGPRDGGFHAGTDFGRDGGSAGAPVYAVREGRVIFAGTAEGYGGPDPAGWLVIDHPAEVGGGTSEYGHIIREVSVGDMVSEGQRIGRINPDEATNGVVSPHLHFSWMPYAYAPSEKQNPMVVLTGAGWPGQAHVAPPPPPPPADGTTFVVDVSEFQDGMAFSLLQRSGVRGVIVRVHNGWRSDRIFRSNLEDARANPGLELAGYVYVLPGRDRPIAEQAAETVRILSDAGALDLPIALDAEEPSGIPAADIREYQQRLAAAGVYVWAPYSTQSWWSSDPILPGSDAHGAWLANYPGPYGGTPVQAYAASGGDGGVGWRETLGGEPCELWQFTDRAEIAGWPSGVDCSAFRGGQAGLRALFHGGFDPIPIEEDPIMAQIRSLIDPRKTFDANEVIGFIDAATWQIRALLYEVARRQGIDPKVVVDQAISAERAK